MSLLFHTALVPLLFAVLVAWAALGVWAENRDFSTSAVRGAFAFVSFLLWVMGLIALLLLFCGSFLGLLMRVFAPALWK